MLGHDGEHLIIGHQAKDFLKVSWRMELFLNQSIWKDEKAAQTVVEAVRLLCVVIWKVCLKDTETTAF